MKKILVLGASGYVGSQLLPILCASGYHVTAAARQIDYLRARVENHKNLDLIYLDLANQQETINIVAQFEVVYFLVHGMAHGHDFLNYELSLATNFKAALKVSKVKHVIYLSSLQPLTGNSEHLKARRMTGDIIRQAGQPVTELRAGVIIGPGSAAFEIMRDFIFNMPLLLTPKWIDSKANPIDLDNLNHYLVELLKESPTTHNLFEIGGPDILSYREQFKIISQVINKPIRIFSTNLLTPKFASLWLGIVTSVPTSIGTALLSGLKHDFIADWQPIHQCYPQNLIGFEEMIRKSIAEESNFINIEVWGFDHTAFTRWQPGYGYYAKQTGACIDTQITIEDLWKVIQKIGSAQEGYFYANPLWRTREWLDILFGGGFPVRRSPLGPQLKVGDYIDSWKVIRCEDNKFLSLLFGMKAPGLGRLEFSLQDLGNIRRLEVTALWHPQGLRGLLYWFAMMPAHIFIFKGMVKAIVKKAKQSPQ
ncbi:SDR family oxidoreductase [Vibrio pectenicida]|uniref:SDR family oxidoreductase n=1 Tax=Vibrio pectenicida TaxID=62763 RepID=A0A7Y4EEG8_9VIBR|nr:SDR family oxidoreductase [Vibrio pectenicida]NOH71734.1 SDR family oxidoreductase [Vibrio pectenicida]